MKNTDLLGAKAFVFIMLLVLLGLIPFLARSGDLYFAVVSVTLNIALILSLVTNMALMLKLHRLKNPPRLKGRSKATPPTTKRPARPPATEEAFAKAVDPRQLPDPGLTFRIQLNRELKQKRIAIGRSEGQIKTYSTEILDNHISIDLQMRDNRDRDIYNTDQAIEVLYAIDLRRNGKTQILMPDEEEFHEMPSRQRILLQSQPDPEGDRHFTRIEANRPLRLRLGDRLREDGKFVQGYFEFHLFTKPVSDSAGEFTIERQEFYLRLYRIFPGYDTAHPTDDGLYPMIDPYLS